MLMASSPDAQERGFRGNGELFRSRDFIALHQCQILPTVTQSDERFRADDDLT